MKLHPSWRRCLLLGALLGAVGCGDRTALELDPKVVAAREALGPIPAEYARGDSLYQRDCAKCHGEDGLGNASGPPLLHRIYQPYHHSDAAFLLAVRTGVRAHHWNYGDMDAMPAVSSEDVGAITTYIRWLQREVGVY